MVTSEVARAALARHGKVRSQAASDWTGTFPLPEAVGRFYAEVGPVNVTIESGENAFFLPSLARLWDFQAGYRWNGLTGQPVDDWDDAWLVVGDQGADPFVFDRGSGTVLHDRHGQGTWEPAEIFPDLNAMAAGLATIGDVVREAGFSVIEPDGSIVERHRVEAMRRMMALLGSRAAAEWVLETLGWT